MKIKWDQVGERLYETGTRNGVLYPQENGLYPKGVAWNGVTAITQSPSGAEPTPLYADDIKYLELMSNEDFGGTIESYTYPDEFGACIGEAEPVKGVSIGQQNRTPFGMSYRTTVGNDVKGNDYGYKLHLVYGAKASTTEKNYQTVNDSPEAVTFSHEFSTTPVEVNGYKPTSHLEIDSTKVDKDALAKLEDILYGTDGTDGAEGTEPRLPLPDEVFNILKGTTEQEAQG